MLTNEIPLYPSRDAWIFEPLPSIIMGSQSRI